MSKIRYKEVQISIHAQGRMDFSVYVTGVKPRGGEHHLGGYDVRQQSAAAVFRGAERVARKILKGDDPDASTDRVAIYIETPRGGRKLEKVLES
jgi:hypothetical protein